MTIPGVTERNAEYRAEAEKNRERNSSYSDDVGALVAGRLLARLGHLAILERADKGVRVFLLVEVAQGVVDAAMAGLIGADVQDEVLHGAVAFGHVPVLHGSQSVSFSIKSPG